jgi:hypothetical protein
MKSLTLELESYIEKKVIPLINTRDVYADFVLYADIFAKTKLENLCSELENYIQKKNELEMGKLKPKDVIGVCDMHTAKKYLNNNIAVYYKLIKERNK